MILRGCEVEQKRGSPPLAGNYYDKYNSRNPVVRHLMKGFLKSVDELVLPLTHEVEIITEIGCGEGNLTAHIASLGIGKVVKGCDHSADVISQAKEVHGKNIDFYVRSIYQADDRDMADLIICCEVMEHLERPAAGLERLRAVTGKYCLLSVPNEPLWRVLNVLRLKYLSSLGNTPGHVNHWSCAEFTRLAGRYFEVVAVRKPLPWVMALCRKR
jgi:SAM-dependent methyltransferase